MLEIEAPRNTGIWVNDLYMKGTFFMYTHFTDEGVFVMFSPSRSEYGLISEAPHSAMLYKVGIKEGLSVEYVLNKIMEFYCTKGSYTLIDNNCIDYVKFLYKRLWN